MKFSLANKFKKSTENLSGLSRLDRKLLAKVEAVKYTKSCNTIVRDGNLLGRIPVAITRATRIISEYVDENDYSDHLARVVLTLGVLTAVRCVMRIVCKGDKWNVEPSVLEAINALADRQARYTLSSMKKNEIYTSVNTKQIATYRDDNTWFSSTGQEPACFSKEFPEFTPEETSDAISDVRNELVAFPTTILRPSTAIDLVEVSSFCLTLGKCVLTYWELPQAKFLDFLAVKFDVAHSPDTEQIKEKSPEDKANEWLDEYIERKKKENANQR